jgi:diguanylate cyclase (GGDEF)-like protein
MLRSVNSFFADQTAVVVGALAVSLMVLLAAVDYTTGNELSFSIFYLIPISIAAWYGNRAMGFGMSLLSALTWMIVETSDQPHSQTWILLWNTGVRLLFFAVVAYLLAELRAQLQRHQDLARKDSLTGLLNRSGFFERAEVSINAASRYGYTIAIAYIDLDGFKSINDTMGHSQGDEALKAVGNLLEGASRSSDVVARVGGDEFVVMLPDTNVRGARAYFEKLHVALQSDMDEHGWTGLGTSIGAVVFEKAPEDISDALRRADDLMYRVKQSGKSGLLVEEAAVIVDLGCGSAAVARGADSGTMRAK